MIRLIFDLDLGIFRWYRYFSYSSDQLKVWGMVTISWCPLSTGRGREFHHPGRGASSDGGWGVRPCWSPVTTDRGPIIWRTGDQRYLRPLSDTEILTPVTTISQFSDDHKNCTVECGLGLERNPLFKFIGWTLVWVWSITRIHLYVFPSSFQKVYGQIV